MFKEAIDQSWNKTFFRKQQMHVHFEVDTTYGLSINGHIFKSWQTDMWTDRLTLLLKKLRFFPPIVQLAEQDSGNTSEMAFMFYTDIDIDGGQKSRL